MKIAFALLLLGALGCWSPSKDEAKLLIGHTTQEVFAQYGAPDKQAFIDNGRIIATWIYGSKRNCRFSLWFSPEGDVTAWQRLGSGFWCPWK